MHRLSTIIHRHPQKFPVFHRSSIGFPQLVKLLFIPFERLYLSDQGLDGIVHGDITAYQTLNPLY